LDSFMWGSYQSSLQNVSGSTQVPICAWNNAWKGAWGLPPPEKLERRDMTYTVSMWRKTQNKQTNWSLYRYRNHSNSNLLAPIHWIQSRFWSILSPILSIFSSNKWIWLHNNIWIVNPAPKLDSPEPILVWEPKSG
jgi:hypothetical protein